MTQKDLLSLCKILIFEFVLIQPGREVHVPSAAKGVAQFHFSELCSRALGPADYLAICRAFHTGISLVHLAYKLTFVQIPV